MKKTEQKFLFVFGHEPWLLPPAMEMIKVLRGRGYQVDVLYVEYLKKGMYDWGSLSIDPHIITDTNKIKLQYVVSREINDLYKSVKHTVVIACDIFALQSLYFSSIPKDVYKVFWAFEINLKPSKFTPSLDMIRSYLYPVFLKKMNMIFVPSEARKKFVEERLKKPTPIRIVLNARAIDEQKRLSKDYEGEIQIIYSGRLSDASYTKELIRGFALLEGDYRLHLAGLADISYNSEIKKLIEELEISDRVNIHGLLSNAELDRLQEKCHIGIVFYVKNNPETKNAVPTKVGDYISNGLIIIGSDQEYLKYWLDEHGVGMTLKNVDACSIKDSIVAAVGNISPNHSAYIRKIFMEKYNMNVCVDHFINNMADGSNIEIDYISNDSSV